MTTQSTSPTLPITSSLNGRSAGVYFPDVEIDLAACQAAAPGNGNRSSQIGSMRSMSALACSSVTPSLKPRDAVAAERRRNQPRAVKRERHDEVAPSYRQRGNRAASRRRSRRLSVHRRCCCPTMLGIAAEALLPIAVGEHRDARGRRILVLDASHRPSNGGTPNACKRLARHRHGRNLLGLREARDVHGCRVQRPICSNDAVLVLIRDQHRRRHLQAARDRREPGRAGRVVPNGDELVGLRIRQRLQQHAVDDAEHGGRRAACRSRA